MNSQNQFDPFLRDMYFDRCFPSKLYFKLQHSVCIKCGSEIIGRLCSATNGNYYITFACYHCQHSEGWSKAYDDFRQ